MLGLGPTQMVLLALTVVVSALTVVPGRATLLQGGVHLVLFAAFLFLAANPDPPGSTGSPADGVHARVAPAGFEPAAHGLGNRCSIP